MNPICPNPECDNSDVREYVPRGSWMCRSCTLVFTDPSPNEAEKEIHVELPSGAIARVTLEGAKDPKLLEALDQMMVAATKQFTAPRCPRCRRTGARVIGSVWGCGYGYLFVPTREEKLAMLAPSPSPVVVGPADSPSYETNLLYLHARGDGDAQLKRATVAIQEHVKSLTSKLAEMEKERDFANGKLAVLAKAVDLAEQLNDAQTDQQAALSCSFNESMAHILLEEAEKEREELRVERNSLRQELEKMRGEG